MSVSGGPTMSPLLMFSGTAEEAMRFYAEVFDNSEILEITRYGEGEMGEAGSVKQAVFSLNGQRLLCIDSPVEHGFTFTPSISLCVSSPDEGRIDRYFERLSDGGQVLMPLDSYEFSRKFAWVQDHFGVSWQLSAS